MKLAILDMGMEQYGDCFYIENNGVKVLIDGGHPGDFDGQPGTRSIPAQLASLSKTKANKPIEVDLLVVTHSHQDHIGCLPRMVKTGLLKAKFALVSDPDHRWGAPSAQPDAMPALETAIDLLAEEVPPLEAFSSMEALRDYLDARANLETQYREMIKGLGKAGVVARYGTDAPPKAMRDLLTKAALTILGPTKEHLKTIAKRLQEEREKARTAARRRPHDALSSDYVRLYAELAGTSSFVDSPEESLVDADWDADAAKSKAKGAVNDLSIVLALDLGGAKILLPGDMQFAEAQVDGLEAMMATLVKKVAAAGPFSAVKLPHHTSYNGWNETLHNTTLSAPLLIHSGGKNDSSHPEKDTLKILSKNKEGHVFLRNDRNGLIEIEPDGNSLKFKLAKPGTNDFSPNSGQDFAALGQPVPSAKPLNVGPSASPASFSNDNGDFVRIHAEIPNRPTRVVITVDIDPDGSTSAMRSNSADNSKKKVETTLPPEVLVVTNRDALTEKVGADWANGLLDGLKDRGVTVLDDLPVGFDAQAIKARIVPELSKTIHRGVLILGGYDVLPSTRMDCLPSELRSRIDVTNDPDQFIVWSDGVYGDVDGDGVQEVPVSRLPDLGSGQFLAEVLSRPATTPAAEVHGVRNVHRPFADKILKLTRLLLTSDPHTVETLSPADYDAPNLYFMLHGDDSDAACYWGESEDSYPEAIRLPQLPAKIDGVVFSGCCWGALPVRETARRLPSGLRPTPRDIASSLALTCLTRGARAYVGCTGAHYSPPKAPYDCLAGPLHRAFWAGLRSGKSPARALFDARIEFFRGIPHPPPNGKLDNFFIALELKMFQQFTCLGRGF